MWIEEVTLENVKCFQSQTIQLGDKKEKAFQWVTFLGENGTGKTTVLQAIGLLLAGPEGANKLCSPDDWITESGKFGQIGLRLHRNDGDKLSDRSPSKNIFEYAYFVVGLGKTSIHGRDYYEPTFAISHQIEEMMASLRASAFLPEGKGWFGAGYGAFRRLADTKGGLVPREQVPMRHTNFLSQFRSDMPLEAFETWMVFLDYQITKTDKPLAKKQFELGKKAINSLLPAGYRLLGVDENGRMRFQSPQKEIGIGSLSDGLRSVLSFAGDLIYRMMHAFPDSKSPLEARGIVLIDELDIHLHPSWQRSMPGFLRRTFPNIQFIVATHSPVIAAGAGSDAVTYRFCKTEGDVKVERISNIFAQSVDDILRSPAFGLVSEFSEETQAQIDTYYALKRKPSLNAAEQKELEATYPFVREALGPGMGPSDIQLEIEALLKEKFG